MLQHWHNNLLNLSAFPASLTVDLRPFSTHDGPPFDHALPATHLFEEEVVISRYACFVLLTSFLWDWASSLPEEVEIIRRKRISSPLVVYYLLRFSTLGACISVVMSGFGLLTLYDMVYPQLFVFFWSAQSTTSLLLFFRILAIYVDSRWIRFGFFTLWILVVLSPVIIILKPGLRCDFDYQQCYVWTPYTLIPNGLVTLNDTLVFLGVSWQIFKNRGICESQTSCRKRFQLLARGDTFYKVSSIVLQSGQLYYGVTIGIQIAATVCSFLGLPYSQLLFTTCIILSSAMACKVFRMVLLCDTRVDPFTTVDMERVFRSADTQTQMIFRPVDSVSGEVA